MTANKVISIILGILLIIAGCYCIFSPALGTATLILLAGISMLVEGIGSLIGYIKERKSEGTSAFTLVGAIISILLGIAVLFGVVAKFALATVIVYLIVAWLIIVGIMRICKAFDVRKFQKNAGIKNPKISWVAMLIIGILMVLIGIFGLVNPITIALALGIILGISILTSGVGLISLACMI